jgi:hypothetical protein
MRAKGCIKRQGYSFGKLTQVLPRLLDKILMNKFRIKWRVKMTNTL